MMACGHSANAIDGNHNPCCAICIGTTPKATQIVEMPNLQGRKSKCVYGDHAIIDSSTNSAFFEHHPDKEYDTFYCGCRGWD